MRERAEIDQTAIDERAAQHRDESRYRALQRGQRRIWQMRNPGDIDHVWQTIVDSLRELEIPFDHCDINVVRQPGTEGTADRETMTDAGLGIVDQFWRAGQTVYRRNLEEEDIYRERARIEAQFGRAVRAVIDVPFSHGTLALNSAQIDPFTPWHIEILEDFARALSDSFRRMEDLKQLEERNRELEREIAERERREKRQQALHRVREQIWRMRRSEEIADVLERVGAGLRAMEVPFVFCGVNIVDIGGQLRASVYSMNETGEWTQRETVGTPTILSIWREGKVDYRRDIHRDDPYGERVRFRTIRSLLDVPFSHGTLAVSSRRPGAFSDEDVDILQELAEALSEGFQRMDDLGALEERNRVLEKEVAERRQAELELYEAKEAAEAANRAKSTFLASMSHELRTPLNAILGFSQLMQRDQGLMVGQRENLAIIARNGEHLLAMINDVLEISRIEAGPAMLQEDAFDLHGLLEELEELFRPRAHERELLLLCERAEDLPRYVRTDGGKLRQVLINLLSNALRFTEKGGVTLRIEHGGGRLRFEVEDTGIGIAPEELGTLFDPFVQTARGPSIQGGTGLGLAISQQFARALGGRIGVRSRVGEGSVFSFEIPIAEATGEEVQEPAPRRRAVGLEEGQPHYRLLVVDDQLENRLLVSRLLGPLGFEVREAVDGREGLEMWAEWRPQLIWMDMRMPVMDGYEATRQIKAAPGGDETAVVALTASAFEEDRRKVLETGCDGFIRKPFREEEIFAALEHHLGARFVYEEEEEEEARWEKEQLVEMLEPQAAGWRAELRKAASQADEETCLKLFEQICEKEPELTRALTGMVRSFSFDELIELIDACTGESDV